MLMLTAQSASLLSARVTVTGAAPAQGITFTATGQTATVTATAAGNVDWTNALGTATAAEPYDFNASMTVGGPAVTFAMDMNHTTIAGNASLWRNMGGKWDRIQGNQAVGKFAKIAVSPNYATDKGVYYVCWQLSSMPPPTTAYPSPPNPSAPGVDQQPT